jgi:helicase
VKRAVEIDPYRLRRALDLTVAVDKSEYVVTGGLEPHVVHLTERSLRCDCADAARGQECKHILAVRLYRGDRELRNLARRLGSEPADGELNLFALWYGSRSVAKERSAS